MRRPRLETMNPIILLKPNLLALKEKDAMKT